MAHASEHCDPCLVFFQRKEGQISAASCGPSRTKSQSTPTNKTRANQKHVICQHYANTFNLVDRFNKEMAVIGLDTRQCDVEHKFFVSLPQVALTQSYLIMEDIHKQRHGVDSRYIVIHEFALQIAKDMIDKL